MSNKPADEQGAAADQLQCCQCYEHITLNEDPVLRIVGTTMKVVEQQVYGWSPEELRFQHPYLTLGHIHSAAPE